MATRAGVTGRQLRLILLTLVWATGPGFIAPPEARAATCGGQIADIDGEGSPSGLVIHGTSGPDVIHGSIYADLIDGRGGHDIICGDLGADHISGGSGNDAIYGDGVTGAGDGANAIDGGPGIDNITGGDGDDTISGGRGTDALNGGADGDDTIFANDEGTNPNRDTIDGGAADGANGDSCFIDGTDAIPANCP